MLPVFSCGFFFSPFVLRSFLFFTEIALKQSSDNFVFDSHLYQQDKGSFSVHMTVNGQSRR